ncbi:MAG: BMP family ABC transporter substrate-binding protein [Burkholderiales bacterium]|nr:BMP family ABC transporter substrate-binding protein [Anaerolineae bacterium]
MAAKHNISVMMVLALLVLSVIPALIVGAQDDIQSVCLVSDTGGINDNGFNQFSYQGAEEAADDYDLDVSFIESDSPSAYDPNITTCLDEGADIVVTVGFTMADSTVAAALANPEVYFIGVDTFIADGPPNMVGLQFREDQAGFLVGALAALTTESGIVGGVYGISIPPVVKFRNGFEQGVAYIDPEVETRGLYIDSFEAADRGAAAAEQLIGEGADVIFGAGGPTGQGAIRYAAQEDVAVIGVDVDEYNTTFGEGETPGAENIISSALKGIEIATYSAIESIVEGEELPFGSIVVYDASNGGVGFAEAHDAEVDPEITAQIEEILAGLQDGSIETGVDPVTGNLLSDPDATPEPMLTAEPEAEATEAAS